MSKHYYEIECKDGIKRQAIEVMKKANIYAERRWGGIQKNTTITNIG